MITNWLLNKIRDSLFDGTIGSSLTHISVGTGPTGESGNDIAMESELVRKPIENISKGNKTITAYIVLDSTEANNTLREIGGHDDAAGGRLWFRESLGLEITKTDIEEMKVLVAITLSGAT